MPKSLVKPRFLACLTFLALFFLLVPQSVWAKRAADPGVKPFFPHEKSDLAPDPNLVFGQLDNGFRYVLLKNNEPRERVAMLLDVQAGSLFETDDQQGIAHFLEHMLFNGSEHFPPGELVKYFQSIGMRYGPDINAHTGFDETVYHVILPKGTEKDLTEGLTVMWDYAAGAHLPEAEIDRERGVILAEKQTRDSVGYRTFVSTFKFILPGTRVVERFPIGVDEDIKAADQKTLKSFYDSWYRPGRVVLVAVGDFDPEVLEPLVRKRFQNFKRPGPDPVAPDMGRFAHKGDKFFNHYEKEAGNTDVSIEVLSQVPARNDSKALEREYLLRDLANQVVQNRLNALKEKPGSPLTSASADSGLFLDVVDYSTITASCDPENWEAALGIIDRTLRQALAYGFTEPEVERVKKDYINRLETAVLKAPTRNSMGLARQIVSNLNMNRVFMSPEQEKALFAPMVEKVTARELHDAFIKSWAPRHRLVQVTGNAYLSPQGNPKSVIQKAWEAAQKQPVAPPEEKEAVRFPFLPAPEKAGKILKKEALDDIGVTRVTFANHLTLLLKPTDFKANEVLFALSFGNGRADEPQDKPGLALLAPAVVNDSGLGPYTREQMAEALAGKTTSMGFQADTGRFQVTGQTVPGELALAFQLMESYLKAPAFREDAFKRTMDKFAQSYQAAAHNVDLAAQHKFGRFFAGGDSRFGWPDREAFFRLTLEDAKDWVSGAINQAPLELAVVGDFDPDEVIRLAGLYLGSLPDREASWPHARSRKLNFPAGEKKVVEVPSEIEKGVVLAAFKTEDVWDIRRTRRLAILGEIFTDRLRERVREKLGLTYSPQAWNAPSRTYPGFGLMEAYVSVDPSKAETVLAEIEAIARALGKGGITEDELTRAKEPSLTGIKELLRKNTYWLGTVLTGSTRHPEQLDWCKSIFDDYDAITIKEVEALAAAYLKGKTPAAFLALSREPDEKAP